MRIYSGSYIQIFLLDEGPSTAMNRRQEKSILSTDERRWTQMDTDKNIEEFMSLRAKRGNLL